MKHVSGSVLVLALLALAACGGDDRPPGPPVEPGPPAAEVFDGMDLTNALVIGVVHAPDGRPAPRAKVYLDQALSPLGPRFYKRKDKLHEAETTTDEAGRFVFPSSEWLRDRIPDPGVEVWAIKGDLVALPQVQLRSDARPVTAPVLTLGPSMEPRVLLVDPEGKPVVDAFVGICIRTSKPVGSRDPEILYQLGAWSDVNGLAVLPRVPNRVDWQVELNVVPKAMPKHDDRDVSPRALREPQPLTVRLARGCTISGRAELPDGSLERGVRVSARRGRWGMESYPSHENSVVTSRRGAFVLAGVPTTDAVVTFVEFALPHSGDGEESLAPDGARLMLEVEGAEGQVVDLGTVRLSAPMSISGFVLDAAGEPATKGSVYADMDAGPFPQGQIGPDGRFRIGGLVPGRYALTATMFAQERSAPFPHQGLQATFRDVEAGATDATIRVTGGGNLIVRFHPTGKPGERLEVIDPGFWAEADYLGGAAYECTDLRLTIDPGIRNDLRIEADGYRPKPLGRVEIQTDRPTILDIELEPSP